MPTVCHHDTALCTAAGARCVSPHTRPAGLLSTSCSSSWHRRLHCRGCCLSLWHQPCCPQQLVTEAQGGNVRQAAISLLLAQGQSTGLGLGGGVLVVVVGAGAGLGHGGGGPGRNGC